MPKKPVIAVIGSLNVDMVTRTPRIPAAGETFTVDSFSTGYGGKGANQAVAAARLSRTKGSMFSPAIESDALVTGDFDVRMIGAVGDDVFGSGCLNSLKGDGVNVESVQTMKGSTGVANIVVDSKTGENRIMVSTGANHGFGEGVDLVPDDADVVVFQLEIPPELVWHNIKLAKSKGKRVIFNPAPAIVVPDEIYDGLDDLIMNETEAAILNGTPEQEFTQEELPSVAKKFRAKGVQNVIITLGAQGVFWDDGLSEKGAQLPAQKVSVVDTTAAGDTFVGAYAVGLQRHGSGHAITNVVAFASKAASLTIQNEGAQKSIPWKNELEAAYPSAT